MNQKKQLFILIGVLCMVCFGYFLSTKYTDKKKEDAWIEAQAVAQENVIYVTQLNEETIKKVLIYNALYDTEYEFELIDDLWIYCDAPEVAMEQWYVTNIISTYSNMKATRKLETGDTLQAYGLENPQGYVVLTDENGVETSYYIGNEVESNNYFTINEKEMIYMVANAYILNTTYDITSMAVYDKFPYISSEKLQQVTILSAGEELVYNAKDGEEFDLIAEGIRWIGFYTCVDIDASQNLNDYGLGQNERIMVTVSYVENDEVLQETFYIGKYEEDLGICYIKAKDSSLVYSVDAEIIEMVLD